MEIEGVGRSRGRIDVNGTYGTKLRHLRPSHSGKESASSSAGPCKEIHKSGSIGSVVLGVACQPMPSRIADPIPSSPIVSAAMRANRSRNTRAEIRVRSLGHARGLRFRTTLRLTAGQLKVTPDLAFPRRRLAVFIDGCFWHQCPEHGSQPKANLEYWAWKFERNRRRDRAVDEALKASDWKVLRIWEHVSAEEALKLILSALTEEARSETVQKRAS